MKILYLFPFLLLGLLQVAQAQQIVSSFQQAEGTDYAMPKLDAQYKSAIHEDPSLAVFTGADQAKLTAAYGQLVQAVGRHLAANGFTWGKPTRCFNRFYFHPDGTIDYYLFHLTDVDAAKQAEFQRLMAEFVKTNRIALQAPEKFSQCSPVVYQDQPK